METKDLSVIIISYNQKELLRNCLNSVLNSKTEFSYEIIVTDSDSKDGTLEMVRSEFPQIKLLDNQENLGFAKGNNVAIKLSSGRLILLLNADTEIKPPTLDLSVKYMFGHPETGAMGCRVLLTDGSLDPSARRRFPNPVNAFYRLFGLRKLSDYNVTGPVDQEMEVDAIMGAYFLVPKSVVDKVGLMDEEFFMYGEDLDWCWRIKEAGYKIMYYPRAEITHFKHGASRAIPFKVSRWAHTAMKIFYRKHYAPKHSWPFNQFVYFGISLRMYMVMIVNVFRDKKTVH